MNHDPGLRLFLFWLLASWSLAACQAGVQAADRGLIPPTEVVPETSPGHTATTTALPAQLPANPAPALKTAAEEAAAVISTRAAAPPTSLPLEAIPPGSSLMLSRPIGPEGRDTVDPTYRFGSTQGGQRDPHHGVEFLNGSGTPVYAAAAGQVIYAGDDHQNSFSPYYNFYGKLVILEHNLPGLKAPLYTLYAHLSEILVGDGDALSAGNLLGRVGMSGSATGSHLHFEVRLGENSYSAARNPELWLAPRLAAPGDTTLVETGALAGVLRLPANFRPDIVPVVVERIQPESPPLTFYTTPYEERALLGQPPWEESFALGDLSPGRYQVSFILYGYQQEEFEIVPGQVTVVEFDLSQAGE